MPTYEYVCRSCDTHLEVVQRFDDAALTECPSCGGALRKAFGNIGIVFKGSGFYKNDSRSVAKSGNGAGKSGEGAKDKEKSKDSAGGGGKDAASASTGEGGGGKASSEASGTKDSSGSKESGSSSAPATKTA